MSAAARYPLLLRGGRLVPEGETPSSPQRLDLAIGEDGRIRRMEPNLRAVGVEEWDLGGRLVLPGMVDAHQHLDKTRTAGAVANPAGTLLGAIQGFQASAAQATREDILRRAEQTALVCLARGTVAIRSHANLDLDWGLRGVDALVELRDRLRDRIRIQVVAFVTAGGVRIGIAQARELVEAALDAGADVIGGAPALAADPLACIDMLFEVAARRGRLLDLHIDETLDPAQRHLAHVAVRTKALGLGGRVVAGHCCSLGALLLDDAGPIIEAVADAGVGVVTLPASNLFLQGRDSTGMVPRGLTRVADLIAAGVRVAYASDNIQDPFNPVGTGDLLEIGRWTFLAGHLPVGALPDLVAMGSTIPAAFLDPEETHGLREGARTDLLILDAENPADALATGPMERTVLMGGRPVAGQSFRVPPPDHHGR